MQRYLIHTTLALLLLAGAVAAFNIWVDPYAIYRYQSADAGRISRVEQGYTMRLSKPWQVVQAPPSALVVGSSRAAAMPPALSLWSGETAYNLSMPGLTPYEMLRLVQHAHASGALTRLTLSIEYETLISGEPRVGLGFQEGRLMGAEPPEPDYLRWRQAFLDARDTLLTGNVLLRSLQAVADPGNPDLRFFPDGSWHNRTRIWLGESGYVMVGRNLRGRAEHAEAGLQTNLPLLAQLLEYCYRQGIDTRIYLSPEHLFLVDFNEAIGLGEGWKAFHRQLIELNDAIATAAGRPPFPIWAFNHLPGVVDEPLPRGAGEQPGWFRDGIHFNSELGAMIMAQIWGVKDSGGYRLERDTLEAYLEQVDAMRRDFLRRQPRLVERYRRKILTASG